jgi:integrase
LPRVPLHGGRHCAASMLADMGYPDVVVAAWLGHTEVQVTHGYQHAMADRMREAGQALGDALAG